MRKKLNPSDKENMTHPTKEHKIVLVISDK